MIRTTANELIDTSNYPKKQSKFHHLFSPPMLSLWFSCFCILSSYLLLTGIAREDYTVRTVGIGALSSLALIIHLLIRNGLHDPFHPDILLTIGHLAQFIIPSTIYATGVFDDTLSFHMMQAKSHFPEMLFAVLIAQTVFNLPFCLLPTRSYNLKKSAERRLSFFIVALTLGVWLARSLLWATDSYYYRFESSFTHTSTLYSPLAVISTLGRIVIIYAAIRLFKATTVRKKVIPMLYLLLEISWHLFSGKREGLLIAILCIIFAYIFVRKRIPITYVLCFLFILFIGSVFLNYYRDTFITAASKDKISIITASKSALRELKKLNTKKVINTGLDRLNDGQFAAGCFKTVPKHVPFLHGKTYKMILWIPVPRVIYHNRPKFMTNYNKLIARYSVEKQIAPDGKPTTDGPIIKHPSSEGPAFDTKVSAPVTTVGEAYINFGWFTIPVVFLLLGIVYRGMDSVFRSHPSYTEAAILIFFSTLVIRMQVDPAVSHLSWMLKILILLLACRIFESNSWLNKKKQTNV